MPSKTSKKKPAAVLPSITKEFIDQMVSGPMSAEAINAASMAFKKALIERALGAELSHHLGYPPGAEKPGEVGNHRNGASGKTVLTEDGPLRIDVPRDRQGTVAIANDQHPDHQLGINRGAPGVAVILSQVLAHIIQVKATGDTAEQVLLGNDRLKVEGVEQMILSAW
jgi:hypothetical protein